MAKLINIVETPEAITAEAVALVWEQYEAPRKRIPRARIVEHRFTVSIPKVSEDAAPLAFVVEHFPEMVGRNFDEYRAGYDQPVRYHSDEFYTPVRMDYRHRAGIATAYESANPFERLAQQVASVRAATDREREEYAEAIARHEIRADVYPARSDRAEYVEEQAERIAHGLIVIDGELWAHCNEPAYIYSASGFFSSKPGYILASTDYDKTRDLQSIYGASERVALAYHHATSARYGFIDVKRPDLVTIDSTARNLARNDERKSAKADEIRANVESLMKELEEAQAEADEARAELEAYTANPRAYWDAKVERLEALEDFSPFKMWRSARAASTRRELAKEA